MMAYRVRPSRLQGHIVIPPSKSHTMRAILFATMADGESMIRHYLPSPDTDAMIAAARLLGATIEKDGSNLRVVGVGGVPTTPTAVIDAGNSGQVLRFVAALAALTPGYTLLTGDESLHNLRSIQPLSAGLAGLGVKVMCLEQPGFAPMMVKGPLRGGKTCLEGSDSQPVSGLLMAAAFAAAPTEIVVTNPGETPWIELTLAWMTRLGIAYQREGYTKYIVSGNAQYAGFDYTVPGDFSSAAFPLVAGVITNSPISLYNLSMDEVQGDKILIPILQNLGADITVDSLHQALHLRPSRPLLGRTIPVNDCIDALPILAVLACFMRKETRLIGAAIARHKESDRITAIAQGLREMGAQIVEQEDGLLISPVPLVGAVVDSCLDHRIAMALAVAGLGAAGETVIKHTRCVAKSYPNFCEDMRGLGAEMSELR